MHLFLSLSMAQNHPHPFYASGGAYILFPSSPNASVGYFALPQRLQHQLISSLVYYVCMNTHVRKDYHLEVTNS